MKEPARTVSLPSGDARILHEGTGADRQLAVWGRAHDIKAVVDHIVAETYEGLSEIALATKTTVAS